MVQENFFHISDLIFPCFLTKNDTSEIQSIPNNFYYTENSILKKIEDLSKKGLKAILAFPKIDSHEKDEEGSFYTKETNFFYQTLKDNKLVKK